MIEAKVVQSLPEIDIAVSGERSTFLERIAELAEASGFAVERRSLSAGSVDWAAINFRASDSGEHESLGFQVISRTDVPGRVLIEVRAAQWVGEHPTRQAYVEAARALVGPLLRAYNLDAGTRHRLRIARGGGAYRISTRTAELIDHFGVLANTSSLHPLDWERFYAIVRGSRQQVPDGVLRERLKLHGFSREALDRLVELYGHLWAYKWPCRH
jgi:hypothetical protein